MKLSWTERQELARKERDATIFRLRGQGWTQAAIADEVGLTEGRICQILMAAARLARAQPGAIGQGAV